MAFKPTKSQQAVLDTVNKNIVVSASAGSGKTTLMINKVISIIENENADISKFLICTFTQNAGEEMKERLYSVLAERIAKESDAKKRKHLIENYEKIELAKISTIDKLCLDLVKKYFYKLKVAPNIELLLGFQKEFLKNRAFKLALEELERDSKEKVDLLCIYFVQDRNIDKLKSFVFDLYENVQINADMIDYLDNTALKLYNEDCNCNIAFTSEIEWFGKKVDELIDCYQFALSNLVQGEDDALISRLTRDIETLKTYFNLDLKNKIKFAFDLSINGSLPKSNNIDVASLTLKKNNFNKAVGDFKKYFDICDVDVLMQRVLDTKKMVSELIDFLKLFMKKFDDIKRTQNQFEFNDIQHMALEILKDEEILKDYIKDIDYIFVDEYQDVNYLQERLIDTLVKSDNLFLVGDVKQSIYGFRLSTPLILLKKIGKFENEENSVAEKLNENFRSDKDILNFVNKVFCEIMTKEESGVDYENDGKFIGSLSYDNCCSGGEVFDKVKVDILLKQKDETDDCGGVCGGESENENIKGCYKISEHNEEKENVIEVEANHIVNVVANCLQEKIYDNKINAIRNVRFKDISILFRKRKDLYKAVVQKLSDKGVKVNVSYKEDVFDSVEVIFINSVLKLLMNFEDDISLVNVLTFPSVAVSDDELAQIRLASKSEKYFSNAVMQYMQSNDNALSEKIKAVIDIINCLKVEIYTSSVCDLINKINKQFDVINTLYALKNKKVIGNFEKFLNEIKSSDIYSLIDYLQYLEQRSEDLSDINLSSGEDSVICQTIHASKGLEYPIVILAGCGEAVKRTNRDIYICEDGIGCDYYNIEDKWKASTIVKKYISNKLNHNEIEESKRLLYVGLTRAKNQLIVVGSVSESQIMKNCEDCAEPSFLQFIISYLKQFEREALLQGGELKNDYATFEIVQGEILDNEQDDEFDLTLTKEQMSEVLDYINYDYKFKENFKVAYKNTVSNLLKDENIASNFVEAPKRLEISEHTLKANEIGTLYHSVLEKVDFKHIYDLKNVSTLLKEFGESLQDGVVKAEEILHSINCIQTLIDCDDEIFKEQPFIFRAKHKDIVQSTCEEKVLVQGVIDLLIKKKNGQVIIVDYKNTSIKDDVVLKEKYAKQLFLYKYATKLVLNCNEVKTYLYSIKFNKLINVD
ncbi:MAG: UvrD-helicase domain-containing protein [Christensenellales bacterium]